eukprot:Opistho-2@82135
MSSGKKVAVFGAGSFGTALAMVASRAGHTVVIYSRDQQQADAINKDHRNPKFMKEFELPAAISCTTDLVTAVSGASMIIHAIPAQRTPDFLSRHAEHIPKDVVIVSTSKGIYVETQQLMSEAIPDALGRKTNLAYLSGPSFAKEMLLNYPTLVVCAAEDESVAMFVQEMMSSARFRVYTTTDVVGVELGGSLKNPLAICAGIAEGLGFGFNTMAALVTRGCFEMRKLAIAMGGRPETLAGLSGVGDLMLTGFGNLSRNRTVGVRLAKGETLEAIMESIGEAVEGVPTAGVAAKLAEQHGLDLPIFKSIALILEGKLSCADAVDHLMNQALRHEEL